jgi:phosphatidylglycerophosphatase A
MNFLLKLIVTYGFLGLRKPAPGTWGTAGAMVTAFILFASGIITEPRIFLILAILSTIVGIYAVNLCYQRLIYQEKSDDKKHSDPQEVVIDEVAGYFSTLSFAPHLSVPLIILAFILFRFFDITKFPPIKSLEKFPRGYGIMIDDLMAGIYAGIVLFILSGTSVFAADGKTIEQKNFEKNNKPEIVKVENQPQGKLVYAIYEGATSDIQIWDRTTNKKTTLAPDPADDEYPRFSPDGEQIVFSSNRSGDWEIFRMKIDGSDLQQLTQFKGKDTHPEWSPDGKKIIFSSEHNGEGQNLYIFDIGTNEFTQVTDSRSRNTFPTWSPVGNEIAYSTDAFWPGWDVMILNLTTRKTIRVSPAGITSAYCPTWSPDGESIIYSYGIIGKVNLWSWKRKNNSQIQITHHDGKTYDARFSKDGKSIFYTAELSRNGQDFQLFESNQENNITKQISPGDSIIRYVDYHS